MNLPKEVVAVIGEFISLSDAVNMASTCKEFNAGMNIDIKSKKSNLQHMFMELVVDHYYYMHDLPYEKTINICINGEIEVVISSENGISFPNLEADVEFDIGLLYSVIKLHTNDVEKVCTITINVYHSDPEMIHITEVTRDTVTPASAHAKAVQLCRAIEAAL